MNVFYVFLLFALIACTSNENGTSDTGHTDTVTYTPVPALPPADTTTGTADLLSDTFYSNQRFRQVAVEKLGEGQYRITGQGQIFEARFGWVVEDGHKELAQGYESTSAGAPAWGDFSFPVTVKKERPNSTLHLLLFETSAKDGSRQHQLPIVLP